MTAAMRQPPAREPAARTLARGLLVPLVAGAACVFAYAPFYAWPAAIVALAVLFAVWSASGSALQAALSGFAFGLGCFIAGVSWVYVSLHVYGSMPAALAALATFLFCAYLAIFPAAAGALVVRLGGASSRRRLALAAPVFVSLEWLRGRLFTGFPWLDVGTSQAPSSPLAGFAPYVGAYGTALAVTSVAALAVGAVMAGAWSRARAASIVAIVAIFAAGAIGGRVEWTRPAGAPVTVALVQGNVPQELKWLDEMRSRTLEDYRRMIVDAQARIVVIPETALPAFLDQLPREYVESLRAHARETGKEILIGTAERAPGAGGFDYYNSLVRLTSPAAFESYRKRHLVPFGEFIPPGFRFVLSVLKIPMSDFSRGEGAQAISAAGVPFAVAICYEDIFGAEMIDFLPRAQALLNVSNVAWFGRSFAADQHLQFSQMRALESGRWMVRSTNTGVTAAIDHRGRVVSRLPAFTRGTLVQAIVPREGSTPYSRWGDWPALVLAAAAIAFCARRRTL